MTKYLFIFFASLIFALQGASAQEGLISGVVIAVTDEDDNSVSDLPVIVDGEDSGTTDDDGEINIGIDSFPDDSDVVIHVRYGDDPAIFVDEEGENNCDDEEDNVEGEDDDDCLLAGFIRGWKPGRFQLVLNGQPRLTDDPGDDDSFGGDDDGMGHPDQEFRFQLLLGRNLEFEFNSITARAQIPVPVGMPITIDPTIEYMPGDDFQSVLAPSLDVNCNFGFGSPIEVFFGAGLRGYRQTFSFAGKSQSDTEWGIGGRAGALYPVGPIDVLGEIDLSNAYSTTFATVRVGAAYKLDR